MCGIAGVLSFHGKPVDERELVKMTRVLAHRGPDGEGLLTDGNVGLGHRRLAILDLTSAGTQPMSSEDKRFHIIYNGEVYNFLEVRHLLAAHGHRFQSESDTEVLLRSFMEWDADCLRRLNGMWAFAVWDSGLQRLFLARDRYGVKPLFYRVLHDRLLFASEIKSLLACDEATPPPNLAVVCRVLAGGNPDVGTETAFEGIQALAPGHWMEATPGGRIDIRRWWDQDADAIELATSDAAIVDQYRDLLDDSCRIRLRSDVPVATLLSGGLDSSSIVATLASLRRSGQLDETERVADDNYRVFTAEYPGLSADESGYASLVAQASGAESVLVRPSVERLHEFVPQVIAMQDSPIDPSLYAVHSVYEAVGAAGVHVTLDGQGADEALSGYEARTAVRAYLSAGRPVAAWSAAQCHRDLTASSAGASSYFAAGVKSELRRRMPGRRVLRRALGSRRDQVGQPEWGSPSTELLRQTIVETTNADVAPDSRLDPLAAEAARQVAVSPLPWILRKFDHAAMAYSVESRMPFMDWRIMSLSLQLPTRLKVAGGYTKVVLRNTMSDRVPHQVLTRKSKLGFPIPYEWMNSTAVRQWAGDVMSDPAFRDSALWDAVSFRAWLDRCSTQQIGNRQFSVLFMTLAMHLWYERHWGRR